MLTARRARERTYPELCRSNRCRLTVLALEIGRRWSAEAATFVRLLARCGARSAPPPSHAAAISAYTRGSTLFRSLLAVFARTGTANVDGELPPLSDILADSPSQPPLASRVMLASWAPPHNSRPLAMTSFKSLTGTFRATAAPASLHTRAAARSRGPPLARKMPERGRAARRWSPQGSRCARQRHLAEVNGKGRRSLRNRMARKSGDSNENSGRVGRVAVSSRLFLPYATVRSAGCSSCAQAQHAIRLSDLRP